MAIREASTTMLTIISRMLPCFTVFPTAKSRRRSLARDVLSQFLTGYAAPVFDRLGNFWSKTYSWFGATSLLLVHS